ncbi:Pre-mRNA-splicing factor CWC22 [Nymphon striatum]|nr:Pre-mRNA-splicing factor CWC22 [Nymphon striatum]
MFSSAFLLANHSLDFSCISENKRITLFRSSRRKEKVGGRYWSDEEMNDDKNYDDSNEKSKEKRKVEAVDKMFLLFDSGVLARAVIQAQAVSGTFTAVYAALVSLINTKYPQTGELILKRLIIQFRKGFKRNDKSICLASTRFIAHLINQLVAHEVLALEILTLLLETPTEDSVEVAVSFLKECGARLAEVSPKGINAIFERLRNVLHESELEKRVQYMIEVVHAVRKDHFADYPAIPENLDLVEEEDQFTHMITLDEAVDSQDILDVFKFDENFEKNEEMYKKFTKGSDSESGSGSGSGSDADESGEESDEEKKDENEVIIDTTETNLIALRRTIYLTVQSSLSFEECCHKILRLNLKPEQEIEVCHMVIDCCAQERTYEKFFGLLAQRFCQLNRSYVEPFQQIFKSSYDTIHRLEVNKLRNITKLFAHLLFTDAISWMVLSHIRLNEEDTTSSSRIFIKILFLELSEYMAEPEAESCSSDIIKKANDLGQLTTAMKNKLATTDHSTQIEILTLTPESWSRRYAANYFETSESTVRLAMELKKKRKILKTVEKLVLFTLEVLRMKNNMKNIFVSRKINMKLKLRMIKCYIWSVLLYGVETWTINKRMEKRLKAHEMWLYRRMGGVSWTEKKSNKEVLGMLGVERQLLNIVKKRKLKYFGHIKRHETIERNTLEGKVEGKRARGRQRLKWEDNIKGWTKSSMKECSRSAKEREDWRFIVANLQCEGT